VKPLRARARGPRPHLTLVRDDGGRFAAAPDDDVGCELHVLDRPHRVCPVCARVDRINAERADALAARAHMKRRIARGATKTNEAAPAGRLDAAKGDWL
jgi:hypothetical protein